MTTFTDQNWGLSIWTSHVIWYRTTNSPLSTMISHYNSITTPFEPSHINHCQNQSLVLTSSDCYGNAERRQDHLGSTRERSMFNAPGEPVDRISVLEKTPSKLAIDMDMCTYVICHTRRFHVRFTNHNVRYRGISSGVQGYKSTDVASCTKPHDEGGLTSEQLAVSSWRVAHLPNYCWQGNQLMIS